MQKGKSSFDTRKFTYLALFTALVVVLQLLGSFIKFGPFSVTLVLLPIVIGAAICGPMAGAWLGLVFGVTVLISGDAAAFLEINVVGTILTVIVKGTLAGLLAGLAYRLLEKVNLWLAVAVSAVVCPIVNTGVFLLGCVAFFMEGVSAWATAEGTPVGEYILFGFVGVNFLFELLFNAVLSPVAVRLLKIRKLRK